MMNKFESRWFIAIIGEVYCLGWKETGHLHFNAIEQNFPLLQKQQQKNVLQDAPSAVDAAKQLKKKKKKKKKIYIYIYIYI